MANTYTAVPTRVYLDIVLASDYAAIKADIDKMFGQKFNGALLSAIQDAAELNAHPACRVYNSSNFSHNSSGNWLPITFNSERADIYGLHSTSSNTDRITLDRAGWWLVVGHILWSGAGGSTRNGRIRVNAATVIGEHAGSTSIISYPVSAIYKFAANDYVTLEGYQDSGGTITISASGNYSPEFSAVFLGVDAQ